MVLLVILLTLLIGVLVYLLGFRLGSEPDSGDRLLLARLEAAQAERQLHELTRQAFVAMAEASMKARDR